MLILSLNSGSSSLKFQLFDYTESVTICAGIVERVGIDGSFIKFSRFGGENIKIDHPCPDHKEAMKLLLHTLTHAEHGVIDSLDKISAVGHRIVHGGEKFTKSVLIDDEVVKTAKSLYDLAPLHNPPNILGVEAAREVMPNVPHVAVLDTAWHQTMPERSYMYALPRDWYTKYGVRRYGFHGTSLLYCAKRAATLLGKDPLKTNIVTLHIGNGASANAVKNGVSYDTSMGLTPLEGLVMGTRAGDHDPAIDLMIMERDNLKPSQMNGILNKKSGVFGITDGKYVDRRDEEDAAVAGDHLAQLALDIEVHRLKKYVGAYIAAVGGVDAIVFTAGVGEMSPYIREKVCEGLECIGIRMDFKKNENCKTRNAECDLSLPGSPVRIFVIPTDEERVIIEDVVAIMNRTYDEHIRFVYPFQKPDYVNKERAVAFERECEKKPWLRDCVVYPPTN